MASNRVLEILKECYEGTGKIETWESEFICCILLSTGHILRGIPTSDPVDAEAVCFKTTETTELNINMNHICAVWYGDISDSGLSKSKRVN